MRTGGSARFNSIADAIGIEQAENALNTGANDADAVFMHENNVMLKMRMPGQKHAADSKVVIDVSEGDKLKLDGTEYTVASVTQKTTRGDIEPLCWLLTENCDDSFIVTYFRIQVDDTLTGDELGHISDLIRSEFSGYTDNIQDPEPKPLMEKQFNNMIYVVSFILMAVMMLNLSRLYTYILAKRKNALTVYSLCGGSKAKIFDIYISEILLTLTVSYLIGFMLFRFIIVDMIGTVYPSFLTFFDLRICTVILGSYIIFGGIVMGLSIAPMIRKSVSELRRDGEV